MRTETEYHQNPLVPTSIILRLILSGAQNFAQEPQLHHAFKTLIKRIEDESKSRLEITGHDFYELLREVDKVIESQEFELSDEMATHLNGAISRARHIALRLPLQRTGKVLADSAPRSKIEEELFRYFSSDIPTKMPKNRESLLEIIRVEYLKHSDLADLLSQKVSDNPWSIEAQMQQQGRGNIFSVTFGGPETGLHPKDLLVYFISTYIGGLFDVINDWPKNNAKSRTILFNFVDNIIGSSPYTVFAEQLFSSKIPIEFRADAHTHRSQIETLASEIRTEVMQWETDVDEQSIRDLNIDFGNLQLKPESTYLIGVTQSGDTIDIMLTNPFGSVYVASLKSKRTLLNLNNVSLDSVTKKLMKKLEAYKPFLITSASISNSEFSRKVFAIHMPTTDPKFIMQPGGDGFEPTAPSECILPSLLKNLWNQSSRNPFNS